jgi:hypothetical protein
MIHRFLANPATTVSQVTYHRWQQYVAVHVWQTFSHTISHSRDKGVGCAQIDTDGNAPQVRVRSLTGF